MPPLCTICFDDEAPIQFQCDTPDCEYMLCGECLEQAFKDLSGGNSKRCQLCKRPSAIRMAEARIGKGGVMAVQRELREEVEAEVRQEQGLYKTQKKQASEMNQEALRLFNLVSEKLNLTCPKCKMVFNDYSGCNALTCANTVCGANFCAICLQDCGSDAHAHVRQMHGNLFDKQMFERSTQKRSQRIVTTFLAQLEKKGKPFDLRQLVRNHLERAGHLANDGSAGGVFKAQRFIDDATRDLEQVICSDRRSLLSDNQDDYYGGRTRISLNTVSPRAVVPDNIRIWLNQEREEFDLEVEAEIEGKWVTASSLDLVKEWIRNGKIPSSGSLATLKQSMRCAVVALDGFDSLYQVHRQPNEKGSEKLKLCFRAVDRHGELREGHNAFDHNSRRRLRVLAINPNHRYLALLKHITEKVNSEGMPTPLQHFIGQGVPKPVFFDLHVTLPETLSKLNEDQRKAGNPLCLKSATEVAGPPGTGKTRTISELVKALLRCTNCDIVVLSERNGAIDAIAEKFASLCIGTSGLRRKVVDMAMWRDIMTFGSADAIGEHTRMFLLEEKILYHPEIIVALREEKVSQEAYAKHGRRMLALIADEIMLYGDKFKDDRAWNQHAKIRKSNSKDLSQAALLVVAVRRAQQDAASLLRKILTVDDLDEYLEEHESFLQGLFPLDFDKRDAVRRLRDIESRLSKVLRSPLFDSQSIDEIDARFKEKQQARQAAQERVKQELALAPRLKMSTIGSSHKLFEGPSDGEDGQDGIINRFRAMAVSDAAEGAIVIFDESGCIPSFELLGLSRLGCPISAILTVGDKKQLPPYNPNNQSRKGRFRHTDNSNKGLKSLLDVSEVRDKISLRTQYRVPRDIATILDTRVYGGNYKTHPRCGAPDDGLEFCHVAWREDRRKYQNSAEVAMVFELAERRLDSGQFDSIMILTPYKNQQRELQFQLKRNPIPGVESSFILTIDQCQGQEADLVIFTLVQRPTRFLNKNRLNVAMSRTRKKLIFVGDRNDFRQAAGNKDWDCSIIAQDILAKT